MFLRLSWTPISDTFAKDLLNRWPLDYLELSGTKVSAECVTELKQLHPKLRIFCRPNSRDGGPTSTP